MYIPNVTQHAINSMRCINIRDKLCLDIRTIQIFFSWDGWQPLEPQNFKELGEVCGFTERKFGNDCFLAQAISSIFNFFKRKEKRREAVNKKRMLLPLERDSAKWRHSLCNVKRFVAETVIMACYRMCLFHRMSFLTP